MESSTGGNPSRAGGRRGGVIAEELQALAGEGFLAPAQKGLRGKVRRLIAEELEGLLEGSQRASLRSSASCSSLPRGQSGRETPLRLVRDYKFNSSSSTPTLPPIGPSDMTRKMQYKRKDNGEVFYDAPKWMVEEGTRPIQPSKHKEMSRNLWASFLATWEDYPEISDTKRRITTPQVTEPALKMYGNPIDDDVIWRNEAFKPGNILVMRKNKPKVDK
eukprot:TRINITY_DN8777_c0_g1_i1.p1 TRINITY_DN8777_c0_g1~~TRINITY_DN8777_c0_g1_i1.p1  ORF type:complete len:242 (-),score=58.74 TRINITY_DN8777_c0_g1_i1:77-730(-)